MEIDGVDVKYFAGFFDKGGGVYIRKSKKGVYTLLVILGLKDRKFLDFLKKNFGGKVYKNFNKKYENYFWQCCGSEAMHLLTLLYPNSILKKEEIEVGLKFASTLKRHKQEKITEEEIKFREALYKKLQSLKKHELV